MQFIQLPGREIIDLYIKKFETNNSQLLLNIEKKILFYNTIAITLFSQKSLLPTDLFCKSPGTLIGKLWYLIAFTKNPVPI